MKKKAFFGGSFDPPHTGHLGVATAALASGRCDEVVWVPGFLPPHKQNSRRSPFADRLAMVKLLINCRENMSVSDLENRLQLVPSYTIDILRHLYRETGEKYLLLIGADSLLALHTWHEAAALVKEFDFITYPRSGQEVTTKKLLRNWDAPTAEKLAATVINGDFFKISSTDVRFSMEKNTFQSNIIQQDGLTDEVAVYIAAHNLYNF